MSDLLYTQLNEAAEVNKKLYEQREAWIAVCFKVKEILTDFDHVNDDPIKRLNKADNLLDGAFASDIVEFSKNECI